MKLALLANKKSIHATRWANSLAERGHEVHLLSMHKGGDALDHRVEFHSLFVPAPLGYFLNFLQLKHELRKIGPDLLHVHYASGYGTLGRLSGFHPCVLSVWGSDIYDFPERSSFHRNTVLANLCSADKVCSTSHVMARYTKQCCPQLGDISVIPFGINTKEFRPETTTKNTGSVTVGTVKSLASRYGIDILIRSFAKVKSECSDASKNLRLVIIGSGPERDILKALTKELNIDDVTIFIDHITHSEVPSHLNSLDIYVAASRSESFGVAILEASACELPVVVSNAGGLPEVVVDSETGFIVQREDVSATADAILRLVMNSELRKKMGMAGRKYVQELYEWEKSVAEMESVYVHLLDG